MRNGRWGKSILWIFESTGTFRPRESGRSSPDVPGKEGYKRMQGDAMHTIGNEALEDRIVVCRPRRRRRLIDLGGDELGHQW